MVNVFEKFTRFIELKDVTVKSDGRVILNIPHAIIPTDRICACIGPNGAGKTTFLKLLDGLIKPDTGSVMYSNGPIRSALVLHHTPMIKASARVNISLVKNVDASINSTQIETVMQQIGLSHLANSPAHKLSAGERQKLCLGRAILQKPSLVLLDEPTANLDPNTTDQVEEIMRQFKLEGSDVIFTSHQLAQVQRLADYIVFIDHGEIKEKGPVGPFFFNPQTQAAKRYLRQELLTDD
jgi:tungstate transport system ATP-binding protein